MQARKQVKTVHACPITHGSPRQVAWARRIYADIVRRFEGAPVPEQSSASWWIDHAQADYTTLWHDARATVSGPFTACYPRYTHADAVATCAALAGGPWRLLDTETTGIKKTDEVISLAVVDGCTGATLFDSLFRPGDDARLATYETSAAAKINGIPAQSVRNAPLLAEVWPEVLHALGVGTLRPGALLSYNARFDAPMLRRSAQRYGISPPPLVMTCAMQLATAWGDRDAWLSLDEAADLLGYSAALALGQFGTRHTALADARLAATLVRTMLARCDEA